MDHPAPLSRLIDELRRLPGIGPKSAQRIAFHLLKGSKEDATRLSAAIAEAIKLPDVAKRLADLSAEPVGSNPAQMAAFMKEDAERWRNVIRTAGVKLD